MRPSHNCIKTWTKKSESHLACAMTDAQDGECGLETK
jgi:hypothetical protein